MPSSLPRRTLITRLPDVIALAAGTPLAIVPNGCAVARLGAGRRHPRGR